MKCVVHIQYHFMKMVILLYLSVHMNEVISWLKRIVGKPHMEFFVSHLRSLFQHWWVLLLVDIWPRIESRDRDIDREVNPRSHDSIDKLLVGIWEWLHPRSLFKSGFLAAMYTAFLMPLWCHLGSVSRILIVLDLRND